MKTIETFKINYVIPETPEERTEIEKLISDVRNERFGVDFNADDLKIVRPKPRDLGGRYIIDKD